MLRAVEIQRMSTQIQDLWEYLCTRSSACLSEVAADLQSKAHMPIDSLQSALSSHLLKFNQAALADKRAADAVVTCLTSVNVNVKKQVQQASHRAVKDWQRVITDYEIQSLEKTVSCPRFMRHAEFVSTLSGLTQTQQKFAAKVLESITTSMFLPSAVRTVEAAQRCEPCCLEPRDSGHHLH